MNRRNFLTRVAKGAAAAVVLAHVPVEWVPQVGGLQDCVALSYLRKHFNEWCTGNRGYFPDIIVVGQDLYEAASGEMICNMRFTSDDEIHRPQPNLRFKATTLTHNHQPGWRIISITGKPMERA